MFGPSRLKLVVVVRLLGGGHRRGWGGFGCGVLWWVEIGVEVQVEVAGVVGFVAVFCGSCYDICDSLVRSICHYFM